ncbi:MAG: hypothetical protein PHD25_05430 [Bacteroidales bacterium]|nr:hypothetical protein [Bacteroidales bacterium]
MDEQDVNLSNRYNQIIQHFISMDGKTFLDTKRIDQLKAGLRSDPRNPIFFALLIEVDKMEAYIAQLEWDNAQLFYEYSKLQEDIQQNERIIKVLMKHF